MWLRVWDPPSSPPPLSAPGAAPRAPETKGGGRGPCEAALCWGRAEPGRARCSLPREQSKGGSPGVSSPTQLRVGKARGWGLSTGTARSGKGCTGTWLLCPRSHPQHAALRVPGGSARLGGRRAWAAPPWCASPWPCRAAPSTQGCCLGLCGSGTPGTAIGGAAAPALAPGSRHGLVAPLAAAPASCPSPSTAARGRPRRAACAARAVRSARSRRLLWVFGVHLKKKK